MFDLLNRAVSSWPGERPGHLLFWNQERLPAIATIPHLAGSLGTASGISICKLNAGIRWNDEIMDDAHHLRSPPSRVRRR